MKEIKEGFLSDNNKKLLRKEEQRIAFLNEEKQKLLLAEYNALQPEAKNFKGQLLLDQLLQENAELRLLYEDINEQLNRKLRKGKPCVLEMSNAYADLVPVTETMDSKLEWKRGKIKRSVGKMNKPIILRIRTWLSIKQFPVYFVETDGEITYIPLDETPIEIKKRAENMFKLGNTLQKMGFVDAVIAGLKNIKKWFDYIPALIPLGIVIAFVLFLSQYQLLPK